MIDIVDQLRAEASYHYFSLFGDAADEIHRLRNALRDIAAVTFCPKCHSKKEIMPSELQARGAAWDIVNEALNTYDEWMRDDDYQAHEILRKIVVRMRERRDLLSTAFAELGDLEK